ncbi:MAG: tetratricopeptide repeat protein, partial [Pyrinomonadaceae bacterium]
VAPNQTPPSTTDNSTPATNQSSPAASNRGASTTRPAAAGAANAGTTLAYNLLQQKQYEAALKEAQQVTAADPKNAEAWKIAGFAQAGLNRFAEAADALQRALDLQRAAREEDPNTMDALARAYVRTEKFDLALPLLTAATTRAGAQPDPLMLYYRGLAEYRTSKKEDAERSFNLAVKADPKSSASLYYLGRIAFERKDMDAAVNALNRATLSDPRLAEAWALLTYSYLQRADAAGGGPKAEADYLSAVRASEGLLRVRPDEASTALHGQALIRAEQYARAATVLERAAAAPGAQGGTLYLLGFAYSRARNFPKAVAALERAAAKTPNDANIYRELGYTYEVTKQYAKALAAYEKGLGLVPGDADFKEAAERVRPFAR